MLEYVKTRLIIVLCVVLFLSVAGNAVLGFMLFKGGIKITKNEYITTHSRSDSYASSGALNLTIMNQYAYFNGKYEIKTIHCMNYDELESRLKSLNICEWTLAKIIPLTSGGYNIQCLKFVDQMAVKKGVEKTIYTEKLNQ